MYVPTNYILVMKMFKIQRANFTCQVIRKSLGLCCVGQSGMSIQILPEPRDTFLMKLGLSNSFLQNGHLRTSLAQKMHGFQGVGFQVFADSTQENSDG